MCEECRKYEKETGQEEFGFPYSAIIMFLAIFIQIPFLLGWLIWKKLNKIK